MNLNKIKKIIYSVGSGIFLPLVTFAAADNSLHVPTTAPNGVLYNGVAPGAEATILVYINIALGLVSVLAVAFLIYGGFLYITSGGNEESAERGKKVITNAIIGLVIIIFSFAIVNVVISNLNNSVAPSPVEPEPTGPIQ